MKNRMPRVLSVLPAVHAVGRMLFTGVLDYSRRKGPWDVQCINGNPYDSRISLSKEWLPDGIICSVHDLRDGWLRTRFDLKNTAVVAVTLGGIEVTDNVSVVELDDREVGRQMARFLLGRGLPHYAFLRLANSEDWAVRRTEGFTSAIRAGGHDTEMFLVKSGEGWDMERRRLARWLKKLPRPCGLAVANDAWARPVLDLCWQLRIKVPDELCVMGCDNDVSVCENTIPTLTSLDLDFIGNGVRMAELLDEMMTDRREGCPVRTVRMPYQLGNVVERQSSNWHTRSRFHAARAHEMIRTLAGSGISVGEIARRLNVSRRFLEMTFRETYNETPGDALRRQKLSLAVECLKNRAIPLTEAWQYCGWANARQLQRVFKAEFGVSPRRFREENA